VSVSQVKLGMESYGSIHLACNASLSKVLSKAAFFLPSRRTRRSPPFSIFSFVSLSTSTGDELSEEAVHLAAGMLASRCQSVVARSIKNQGALVGGEFYNDLMERFLDISLSNVAYE